MRKVILSICLMASVMIAVQACGPSAEEQRAREQAIKDSLAQVRADSVAKAEEAARQAKLEQERQRKMQEEKERRHVEYAKNGDFAVQVQAWRSEDKAKNELTTWKKRGYNHAYVVQYGDSTTGNVWFRVRLGTLATRKMAEKLQNLVKEDYKAQSWISKVK